MEVCPLIALAFRRLLPLNMETTASELGSLFHSCDVTTVESLSVAGTNPSSLSEGGGGIQGMTSSDDLI